MWPVLSCPVLLTVHGREGHDVPRVGGQREHVQLVVAHEAALAVPQGEHEALVEAPHHVTGALGAESGEEERRKKKQTTTSERHKMRGVSSGGEF